MSQVWVVTAEPYHENTLQITVHETEEKANAYADRIHTAKAQWDALRDAMSKQPPGGGDDWVTVAETKWRPILGDLVGWQLEHLHEVNINMHEVR